MTIKDKKTHGMTFLKLVVVSFVVFGVAIGLTYLGIHFSELAEAAKKSSMPEFFYGVGTLVIGIFCFISYAGAAGTFAFTLFLWFKPDLLDDEK